MRTSVIEKYKATRDEIDSNYNMKVRDCNQAYELIGTIDRLLPTGWVCTYATYATIYLRYDGDGKDKTPAFQFREVCRHVERITGEKVTREVGNYNTLCLIGRASCKGIGIHIQLGNPDCKVTYTEKEVPASTIREVVVPPECLGEAMAAAV